MKLTNEALGQVLREFAHEYNHYFRSDSDIKYAIVYLKDGLKFFKYVGADIYSDIWFDDAAVTRLAMELYRDDLIKHLNMTLPQIQDKKKPKKMTVNEIEEALGYKVEIVSG